MHMSYDGSFQLYRKDKAYDSWDQCLTDGRMYFAQSAQYNEFLSNVNTDGTNATSRHSACNNHKAADNNWVKFTGVAETGVGSAICARHSCFLPLATVNFNTPERFYYADFCFVSAITRSLSEGVTSVGIHHDILCHYIVKMWEQWARMKHPLRSLTPQDFLEFIASVPKFHLAGHVDICFILYCLNHIFGVGRLDAEGGERCWANLNHAAASTCKRGPGSRVDTLNYVMHQWNWSKTVRMALAIATRIVEARKMAHAQKLDWEAFHNTIDTVTTDHWATLSLEPQAVDGKTTSVFSMPDTLEMSLSLKMSELALLESSATAVAGPSCQPGTASWIVDGLELQNDQHQLVTDVKAYGTKPTPRQTAAIATRRAKLLRTLEKHRQLASQFFPLSTDMEPSAQSSDGTGGQPELMSTLLPSDYPPGAISDRQSSPVIEWERQIQRVACLKYLQTVRMISIQKVHVSDSRSKHTRGVKSVTREATQQQRLAERLAAAAWAYNTSRDRLMLLSSSDRDANALRPLTPGDLSSLTEDVKKNRSLGQGWIKMPWYWRVNYAPSVNDTGDVTLRKSEMAEECSASIRVEWFRGRERYKRWEEEVFWLEHEAASVASFFTQEHWRGGKRLMTLILPDGARTAVVRPLTGDNCVFNL
ncbi:hypothetical protein FRC09_018212 [Ceratobasidium sp. 395]|nr:hypothetical protein FRC09_018212 [Ceratobasidium sp. 395]